MPPDRPSAVSAPSHTMSASVVYWIGDSDNRWRAARRGNHGRRTRSHPSDHEDWMPPPAGGAGSRPRSRIADPRGGPGWPPPPGDNVGPGARGGAGCPASRRRPATEQPRRHQPVRRATERPVRRRPRCDDPVRRRLATQRAGPSAPSGAARAYRAEQRPTVPSSPTWSRPAAQRRSRPASPRWRPAALQWPAGCPGGGYPTAPTAGEPGADRPGGRRTRRGWSTRGAARAASPPPQPPRRRHRPAAGGGGAGRTRPGHGVWRSSSRSPVHGGLQSGQRLRQRQPLREWNSGAGSGNGSGSPRR